MAAAPRYHSPIVTARSPGESPTAENRRRRAAARDLTLHATLLAVILWAAVGADLLSPGPFGRISRLQKGNDFVQFYTLASLVRSGDFESLEDDAQFRRAQRPYLAPGATRSYPPVYGPQIGVLLVRGLGWSGGLKPIQPGLVRFTTATGAFCPSRP